MSDERKPHLRLVVADEPTPSRGRTRVKLSGKVHFEKPQGEYAGDYGYCGVGRLGSPAQSGVQLTKDPAAVTCKICLRSMDQGLHDRMTEIGKRLYLLPAADRERILLQLEFLSDHNGVASLS